MTFKEIKEAPVGTWFAFIYQDVVSHNVGIMRKKDPGDMLTYYGICLCAHKKPSKLDIYYERTFHRPVTKDSAEWYHVDTKSFRTVKQVFVRYMLRSRWGELKIKLRNR